MKLAPNSIAELSDLLACAHNRGERVEAVDLSALRRVLEHKAEDMTATVEAGLSLNDFQTEVRKRNQWLPLDPVDSSITIAELLNRNASGPRRFGYGTVGDYLIGLKVVLADGRLISSGGKVVKNVAGYDLAKLFIGAQGSLGVIIEATFKLRPVPEAEQFVTKQFTSLDEASQLIEKILDSDVTPIVFDLHNGGLVLGFSGTKEEVQWQLAKAAELGVDEPATLDYEKKFWNDAGHVAKRSVLPSKIVEAIRGIGAARFVARVGNGIVFHRGAPRETGRQPLSALVAKVKVEFDPKNIFPEAKW